MENPWIFADTRYFLLHGVLPPARQPREKTDLILRHTRMALIPAITAMNSTPCAT